MSEDRECRKLLDSDGENRAVRTFLMLYGGTNSPKIKQMQDHLRMSGFDGCWPKWVEGDRYDSHLTKAGAQDWLRHLFALEGAAKPAAPAPSVSADPLQELADEAQELDMGYGTNACPTCGKSASVSDAKDAERISTLREAVIDAADEWSQYVEVDSAPRRCSEHVGMAFDAALAAQSKEGGDA